MKETDAEGSQVDVVVVTEDRFETAGTETLAAIAWEEERLFVETLERHGARVRRVSWSNPTFDWSQAGVAVIRSTWDYVDRFDQFRAWVDRAAGLTRLVNPPALVRWNWDKGYLLDLERRGVRIPATLRLTPTGEHDLPRLIREAGWEDAVLKPTISSGSFETYRLRNTTSQADWTAAADVAGRKPTLLQEYLPGIETEGELSLIFFGGEFSHAVRKRTKGNDFRVQAQYGGRYEQAIPAADELTAAELTLRACEEAPVYARVDLVRNRRGEPCLMELELIEPDLYCRLVPAAADRFAEALLRQVGR